MKKYFILIMVFAFMAPLFVPADSLAKIEYTPLAPLPGTTQGDCAVDAQGRVINPASCKVPVTNYIPRIFTLLIGFAGVLAVLMIVIGGVQYLSTDAISGKSEAKERITNAILGLLLAIGSYVILNTINPKALEFNLDRITERRPPDVQAPATTTGGLPGDEVCKYNEGGGKFVNNKPCMCNNCVSIGPTGDSAYISLPFTGRGGNKVHVNLANKLLALNQDFGQPWRITEAWKPSYYHRSTCHIVGTCIDAGLMNPIGNNEIVFRQRNGTLQPLANNIQKFFEAASRAGLTIDFEVKSEEEASILRNAGVTGSIKVVSGITAPHWSVYLNPNKR